MTRTVRLGAAAAAAALLAAFGLPAAGVAAPVAEGPIVAAPGAEVVPGSYVVVLKDRAGAVTGQARTLAAEHDATVRATYSHALRGFAATMSERQARRMAADPAV